jgi:hypothetical protein
VERNPEPPKLLNFSKCRDEALLETDIKYRDIVRKDYNVTEEEVGQF